MARLRAKLTISSVEHLSRDIGAEDRAVLQQLICGTRRTTSWKIVEGIANGHVQCRPHCRCERLRLHSEEWIRADNDALWIFSRELCGFLCKCRGRVADGIVLGVGTSKNLKSLSSLKPVCQSSTSAGVIIELLF